jgi:hypothetical protein
MSHLPRTIGNGAYELASSPYHPRLLAMRSGPRAIRPEPRGYQDGPSPDHLVCAHVGNPPLGTVDTGGLAALATLAIALVLVGFIAFRRRDIPRA